MDTRKTAHLLKFWKVSGSKEQEVNKGYSLSLVDKIANVFSAGNFYYYVFNFLDFKVDFVHPNVQSVLGIAPEDFSMEAYLARIHPKDVKSMHMKEEVASQFLREIPPEDIPHYKISYLTSVKTSEGIDKTILHQGIPLAVTDEHRIGYMLVIHTDVSYLDVPFDDKLSIIGLNGQPSWYCVDPANPDFSREDFPRLFSAREREVLSLLSEGKKSEQIANLLHISVETVRTHRKNILVKTRCKNTTELVAKCIKAGLI